MIMDLVFKIIVLEIEIDGCLVRMGGIVKGFGMIYFNMVIMLVFVICDVVVFIVFWQQMFSWVI